jgi:hypothetical protein
MGCECLHGGMVGLSIHINLCARTPNVAPLEGGASGGGRLEIVEESFVRCRNNSTSIFLQLAV